MKRFIKSFYNAVHGVRHAIGTEQNFRLESMAAILVILLMYLVPVTQQEKTILVLVIAGVLVVELINTAIERVVDMLKPRVHPYARIAKDVMAAASLVASIGAVIIGIIIFYPYLFHF